MVRRIATVAFLNLFVFLLVAVSLPQTASAYVAPGCRPSFLGFPAWYAYLDVGPETIEDSEGNAVVVDPCAIIGPTETIEDSRGNTQENLNMPLIVGYVAVAVVEILLRVSVIAALGFVMYGGFRYITSQGEPEATKSARQTIQNALIGMVIALIATGIVTFVARELTADPPVNFQGGGGNSQQAN